MKTKTMLIALAVVVGAALVMWSVTKRPVSERRGDENAAVEMTRGARDHVVVTTPAVAASELATRLQTITSPSADPQTGNAASRSGRANAARFKQLAQDSVKAAASQPAKEQELVDPVARIALSFVGADPDAEAYWIDAINDPNLSPHERQDLIEDLNEEGFADPHHPTLEDLPLIVSRLMIIEELAPDAMDDVNSDAFDEAKKDLERMAYLAQE
jgi:hypothetical protein